MISQPLPSCRTECRDTLSSSSPALMACSVGTPSSSSSAVPSMDLFTCLISALWKKNHAWTVRLRQEEKTQTRDGINASALYLIDSVSMWTGAILSNKNFTISRKGLLGCLGLPSFFVISFCKKNQRQDLGCNSHNLRKHRCDLQQCENK